VKALYRTMRTQYEQFAGSNSFLISGTLLGGQFGYDDSGALSPIGGAVAGFTKTFKRERMNATAKVVDFGIADEPARIADLLLAETLADPGAMEIGYKDGLRWTVTMQEQPVEDGLPGMKLGPESVFVVTGAAGSIVSAITSDLASASGGTFYLLDVVQEPDPKNEELKIFATNKDSLKGKIAARLSTGKKKATPVMVEKELANLERLHAAQSAIDAVKAAGGTAHYRSVNMLDAEKIEEIVGEIKKAHGRVDVLLHAAGLERSHFLPDKPAAEFDLVFDVKADGFFHLLHAIGEMPLGAVVVFSSIAGRFGNAGQADYSSANDLLCKIVSSFRNTRPGTRGIAIDWTAWGKIGMATRGSIPKMMELAGIDMLDPEAGVPWIRRELTMGGTRNEVVVAQRLGVLLDELDATGGLDLKALESSRERLTVPGPMVGKITGMGVHSGLLMETELDPNAQPFLNDHRIEGTPVLPGVMGIEAFAEAALCVHPGWHVANIEEVNFLAPFKFYKDEPRTLLVQAMFRPEDDHIVSDCRLVGRRTLSGRNEVQETVHFTARVRLSKTPLAAKPGARPQLSPEMIVDSAKIYRVYFHGPAYQVLERAWFDGTRLIGELNAKLPINHQPSKLRTQMAPRLIELCFQTAGLWEMGANSKLGLPMRVDSVTTWKSPELGSGHFYAMVTPHPEQGTFDAEVVDAEGNRYLQLDGYRTVGVPLPMDADTQKALQQLVAPAGVILQEVN
jgi:NAD(P)-dependent dehydrogenase (short-subunit alcohol dehydrogenase family)